MKKPTGLSRISKPGFIRSVVTRALGIFIAASIIITAVAIISFTSEIRRSFISDRYTQLVTAEQTISERMETINSIAYNIGTDNAFYLDTVSSDTLLNTEMTRMLERYLVGHDFIEHLAFTRTAEPDIIYTSDGTRSLSEFFTSNFGMDITTANDIKEGIHSEAVTGVRIYGSGDNAYFAYSYPLPQLSPTPKAHVLMMIPVREVTSIMEALLVNANGKSAIYNAQGTELYSVGTPDDELDLTAFLSSGETEEEYKAPSGTRYVIQKVVSETNGWSYVSVMLRSDTLTELANRQILLIVLILILMMVAVIIMVVSVIFQYKPISKLAAQMAEGGVTGASHGTGDERYPMPS